MQSEYKAAYYEEFGLAKDVLKFGNFKITPPSDDEVLVKIKASGINPSDVKLRSGQREMIQFPHIIPHSDGAGIIEEVGKNVLHLKKGNRVWIYNAAWKRPFGTAGEYCTLPASLTIPLPDHLTFEEGACLGVPALTAAACLLSLNLIPNSIIVVTGGAGSVGHLAIQLAKFLGHRVITTVSSIEKEEIAKAAGTDFVLNYNTDPVHNKIIDITNAEGVDGFIDVDFGTNLEWSFQILKENATIASYASEKEPFPTLPFYKMMFKALTLKTIYVYILPQDLRQKALELIEASLFEKLLKPIIHETFPLEGIATAHQEVEKGTKIGQIVLSL